jgi:Fur family ferric uptake transcriptional regulator
VARYEARVGDNHHHVVCRSCGAIADVDCAVGYAPCLTADDDAEYQIDEAEVIFWGRCPKCVSAPRARPWINGSPGKEPGTTARQEIDRRV